MLLVFLVVPSLWATEYHGIVRFGGLPLPGATLTATQGETKQVASTGLDGTYSFPNLPDGDWKIHIEMLCFTPVEKDITIAPGVPAAEWEMKLLPIEEIRAAAATAAPTVSTSSSGAPVQTTSVPTTPAAGTPPPPKKGKKPSINQPPPVNTASAFQRTNVNASAAPPQSEASSAVPEPANLNQSATDSLAINGSVNNAASSPFGMNQAFGNNRRGIGSLYNGNISLQVNNSALDARNYSLNGADTPKAAFNQIQGGVSLGGPLRIPHLIPLRSAPNFFIAYQIVRNRNGNTQTALVPTADQRAGNFSQPILDPTNGQPFAGNIIPLSRISPQALALLRFYPLPNATGPYNYQSPVIGRTDTDSLQSRLTKGIGRSNQVFGNFGYQNVRNQNNNIFNFLDHTNTLSYQVTGNWMHRFSNRIFTTTTAQFSRQTLDTNPYFANRQNVSGEAGITGNDQAPVDWGPPSLNFGASNIYGLSDATDNHRHAQTAAIGSQTYWAHSPHNFTFGGDYKRQDVNILGQANPRGNFTFNGQATGNDFADYLLGVPDASSIAYGNADKYFRSSIYDLYLNDDWRVTPSLTVNAGVRWEYWTPISEKYGRLVNLDIAHGFSAAAPVIGNDPTGSLTGTKYPASLVNPDRHAFSPKIGIAWRPISGSSLVIRAGYAVAYDTSVYQTIANRMAQQSPLSKSFSVQNTPAAPLTLADGFIPSSITTPTTFAIDPNFRIGYAQSWQVSVQRDLPGALVINASYLGIKGTRGVQQFLPNTYPPGAINPCVTCLPGYTYMASNGNSTNEKGTVQLRRRLHNGFTATAQYTYSKAIDDAALGGGGQGVAVIAQNWLDLSAERGLSPFDQRHQVTFQGQYTTGVGLRGGTLLDGWRGTVFKEWTVSTSITAGTGMPITPIYSAITPGTGISSSIRPNYTGAPLYDAPSGLFLNPAAFVAPPSGQWGNVGRNSIEGPDVFTITASAARTFRLPEKFSRLNLDVIASSNNPINHPTFQSWVTNIQSQQFGLPANPNGMRTLQLLMRVRF